MQTPTAQTADVDSTIRQSWANGRVVIQGTFLTGPDRGELFLVTTARREVEQILEEILDGRRTIPRRVVAHTQHEIRKVVQRGVRRVSATRQDVFNQDIILLMIFMLAYGEAVLAPAGVDLGLLLDTDDTRSITARGGLDPELMACAPGAQREPRRLN